MNGKYTQASKTKPNPTILPIPIYQYIQRFEYFQRISYRTDSVHIIDFILYVLLNVQNNNVIYDANNNFDDSNQQFMQIIQHLIISMNLHINCWINRLVDISPKFQHPNK